MDGEDLIDYELEEKLYAKLSYNDETQPQLSLNVAQDKNTPILNNTSNAPKSSLRRYWHTDTNNPSEDVNLPKQTNNNVINFTKNDVNNIDTRKHYSSNDGIPKVTELRSLPVSQAAPTTNPKRNIKINDKIQVIELVSSDEDEVIEIALPPKPTITIESSEEEEELPAPQIAFTKKCNSKESVSQNTERDSASPVPSVVSSVSDDFIRGDCIALNISSKRPADDSFDFSLHGNDLLGQSTSKKRKKKKNKDRTSTPISNKTLDSAGKATDECFATPRNKSKKQKNRSYIASAIPNADVYDSDSNQSTKDTNNDPQCSAIENNTTSANVHDSNNSTIVVKENITSAQKSVEINNSDSVLSLEASPIKENTIDLSLATVDLTGYCNENSSTFVESVEENIVMANVSGITESKVSVDDEVLKADVSTNLQNDVKYGSTKVPSILCEDMDFDNVKSKKVWRQRRYSLTTLRAEMEKFYNESWGGENFNHKEIQKNMSRDKSLWAIDPEDKRQRPYERKLACQYCNRHGHRENTCYQKPAVCHMCGTAGHCYYYCPRKICCNCGSPNEYYSTTCKTCSSWHNIDCNECDQRGHPSSHCPDLWRRYHNTIDVNSVLVENNEAKKCWNQYCSGCARRGHLVNACRTIRFSNYFINSPYVGKYIPLYYQQQTQQTNAHNNTFPQDSITTKRYNNKRQTPHLHETHLAKKRMLSNTMSEQQNRTNVNETTAPNKETNGDSSKMNKEKHSSPVVQDPNRAPDFIPINSNNHNEKGQVIQDNEVSDTSYVISSSRVYITSVVMDKLETKDGEDWLKATSNDCNVTVEFGESKSFFNIKGKVENQEIFQNRLREWTNGEVMAESTESIPTIDAEDDWKRINRIFMNKNTNYVAQLIKKKFARLSQNLGDPSALYGRLVFLQNRQSTNLNANTVESDLQSIKSICSNLNMVLFGQAGLEDGFKHLNELQYIYNRILKNRRELSMPIRKEIKKHYWYIFSTLPRSDYEDLLEKYYLLEKPRVVRDKSVEITDGEKMMVVQGDSGNLPSKNMDHFRRQKKRDRKKRQKAAAHSNKTVVAAHTLLKYQRQLLDINPSDSYRKRMKLAIIRKLKSQIDSVSNSVNMPPKIYKKVRKVQEQAELFLSSV